MRFLLFNRTFCSSPQNSQAGFTLIELLLIIVLLGVLAVGAINAFDGNEDQGRLNVTRLEMVELQKALLQFRRDNRELPCMAYRIGDFSPNSLNDSGNQNFESFGDGYVLPANTNASDWYEWCLDDFKNAEPSIASNALRMLNTFPYAIVDFDFLLWDGVRQSGWNGPYITSEALTDGWDNPYLLLDPELSYNQRYRCLADGTEYAVDSDDLYDCQLVSGLADPTGYELPADIVRIVSMGPNGKLESQTSQYNLMTDDLCAPPPGNPASDDLILCLIR